MTVFFIIALLFVFLPIACLGTRNPYVLLVPNNLLRGSGKNNAITLCCDYDHSFEKCSAVAQSVSSTTEPFALFRLEVFDDNQNELKNDVPTKMHCSGIEANSPEQFSIDLFSSNSNFYKGLVTTDEVKLPEFLEDNEFAKNAQIDGVSCASEHHRFCSYLLRKNFTAYYESVVLHSEMVEKNNLQSIDSVQRIANNQEHKEEVSHNSILQSKQNPVKFQVEKTTNPMLHDYQKSPQLKKKSASLYEIAHEKEEIQENRNGEQEKKDNVSMNQKRSKPPRGSSFRKVDHHNEQLFDGSSSQFIEGIVKTSQLNESIEKASQLTEPKLQEMINSCKQYNDCSDTDSDEAWLSEKASTPSNESEDSYVMV